MEVAKKVLFVKSFCYKYEMEVAKQVFVNNFLSQKWNFQTRHRSPSEIKTCQKCSDKGTTLGKTPHAKWLA